MAKAANKAESDHMDRVAGMGCIGILLWVWV